MLFGKRNHLVGLDIGSVSVKVAEVVETKRGKSLKRFGALDLKPGAIVDGVIRDPGHVAEVIRELFVLYHIREVNVAVSIGGYSAIVKKITMPRMEEEELQKTIFVEAEQYIPFDISEVYLDFQVMGPNPQNPNQMSVLLVAAKKEMVDQYAEIVDRAGLTPCIVDIDAFAVQNIFGLTHPEQLAEVILINVGASKISLNIVKGGDSIFMRDVSMGCRQVNERIMALVGCSFEAAEELKIGEGAEQLDGDELRNIVSQVSAEWCTEIGRALDFFYSTYPGERIEQIALSGGGANIDMFIEALAAQTGARVSRVDSFAGVEVDPDSFDTEFIRKVAPQAAICMGLALRKMDDK